MDYKAGVVHLSSSDGTLLEIPESKLSPEDLTYVQSLDGYKKEKRKVTSCLFFFPVHSLILFGTGIPTRYVLSRSVSRHFSQFAGSGDTSNTKRPSFVQKLLRKLRPNK